MKLLAIIEDKNKILRAHSPALMTPYKVFTEHFGYLGDESTRAYLLVESTVKNETEAENVAVTDDNYLVLTVSTAILFTHCGRPLITRDTTWDEFMSNFTQELILQAVEQIPIPSATVGIDGEADKGVADVSKFYDTSTDVKDVSWIAPDGSNYLQFGTTFNRPQAYTLDSLPGVESHFGSRNIPGIRDEALYASQMTDIILTKDFSCKVNFKNVIPVVNGLMYMPTVVNEELYIETATELFWNTAYQYSSVMLLDMTDLNPEAELSFTLLSDMKHFDVVKQGKDYVITLQPKSGSFTDKTLFLSFDGRLISFDRIKHLNENTIRFTLSDTEIRYMRERDMQLMEKVKFNYNTIKLNMSNAEWIKYVFMNKEDELAEASEDSERLTKLAEAYNEEGVNPRRSFICTIPSKSIYIHEYRIVDRVMYNGLLIHGNIGGILQSLKGHEIFEYVRVDYMDMHILTPVDITKSKLVYGSDAHLLGYAPYEYLSTLENNDNKDRFGDFTYLSTPFVDRTAPEAVIPDGLKFRLLDIVSLE